MTSSYQAYVDQGKALAQQKWAQAQVVFADLQVKGKVKYAEAQKYFGENPDTVKKVGFVFAMALLAYLSPFATACGFALGMALTRDGVGLKDRITNLFKDSHDMGRGALLVASAIVALNVLLKISFYSTVPFAAGYYLGSQFESIFPKPVVEHDTVVGIGEKSSVKGDFPPSSPNV